MAFPVRIYRKHPDEGGKVRRTISTKMLEKRSDAALTNSDPYRNFPASNEEPVVPVVHRCAECGKVFTKTARNQKYCINEGMRQCGNIAFKRRAAERGRQYRAQKKKARQVV